MSDPLAVTTTIWGIVMALAPLLQLRVIVRKRDASGTSPAWVAILLVGFVLWLAYGLVNQVIPLVVTNMVSALIAAALLVTMAVYRRRRPPAPTPASGEDVDELQREVAELRSLLATR